MSKHPAQEFKKQFKLWNAEQKALRALLEDPADHDQAISLFLRHHALLHEKRMAQTESFSFADAVLDDLDEEQIRHIPQNGEHAIAWLLWHMTRIEDVAMNTLVAGKPQILNQEGGVAALGVKIHHTGNAMTTEDVEQLSATINIMALREYRVAVGRRTQEIVKQLRSLDMNRRVDPDRLQQVMDQGDLVEAASGIGH